MITPRCSPSSATRPATCSARRAIRSGRLILAGAETFGRPETGRRRSPLEPATKRVPRRSPLEPATKRSAATYSEPAQLERGRGVRCPWRRSARRDRPGPVTYRSSAGCRTSRRCGDPTRRCCRGRSRRQPRRRRRPDPSALSHGRTIPSRPAAGGRRGRRAAIAPLATNSADGFTADGAGIVDSDVVIAKIPAGPMSTWSIPPSASLATSYTTRHGGVGSRCSAAAVRRAPDGSADAMSGLMLSR